VATVVVGSLELTTVAKLGVWVLADGKVQREEMRIRASLILYRYLEPTWPDNYAAQRGVMVSISHLMDEAIDMMSAHLFILWTNEQICFHTYPLTRIPGYLV
jgi:hypothetical protein